MDDNQTMHRPVEVEVMYFDCVDGGCDHEENECPMPLVTVCAACSDKALNGEEYQPVVEWPCRHAAGLSGTRVELSEGKQR